MKHLGDISKINGAEIEPVDIITFGSPCQDLSVAGKRAGLEGARSGLFMDAVRIIKEMREATNGQYPTYALWENVPGAFSSNKGEDFRVVLEELIKIAEPSAVMPAVPPFGWAYADSYVGNGWSLAYRVFDTQYWPRTPQRRRRIYLVADFRGQRAREVLFEREGLRGHLTESSAPRERVTAYVEVGPGAADIEGWTGKPVSYDARGNGDGETVSTITGDHENRITDYTSVVVEPVAAYWDGTQTCGTLTARNAGGSQRMPDKESFNCVIEAVGQPIVFDKEVFQSGEKASGGHYISEGGPAPALRTTGHPPGVCVAGVDCRNMNEYPDLYPTLQAKPNGGQSLNFSGAVRDRYIVRRLTPTECARLQGFPDRWGHPKKKEDLTDEEYHFWLDVRNTHAAINGKAVKEYTKDQMLKWYSKLHSDSAEYKMWGNGIALPPTLYCMQGITDALNMKMEEKEYGMDF